ncbi:alpha/beta hydrolase-fold protein [Candidatus Izimaplasma bacterium ZiA1]|uniref:alpha/beta hydrolase n=1 Tax=Candidatus Izimoplasma sp. ZiA1 TaxID=2024899 RepID=UPI001439FB59
MRDYKIITMYSEELEREVKIYLSLPNSYEESDKLYPVLYMHDGNIAFNDYEKDDPDAVGIMDLYMESDEYPEVILVGLDSTKARTNEFLPVTFTNPKTGNTVGGKASNYMDFMVNKVKPMINEKYRTLDNRENTALLGMSLGGVLTYYAATKYLEHFSMFAGISNAFVPVRKQLVEMINEADLSTVKKMYLDVGSKESESEENCKHYIDSNNEVYATLKEKLPESKLSFTFIEGAGHNENDWQLRFPKVIEYLFKD